MKDRCLHWKLRDPAEVYERMQTRVANDPVAKVVKRVLQGTLKCPNPAGRYAGMARRLLKEEKEKCLIG